MQPQSAQNMIITSNKKKKYTNNAQTSLNKQQQLQQFSSPPGNHQQYHVNKGFNVLSISMTTNSKNRAAAVNTGQQQQHTHHLQHYHGHSQHHQQQQQAVANCQINQSFVNRAGSVAVASATGSVTAGTGTTGSSVICATNAVVTLHHNGHHTCPDPLNTPTIFNMSSHRAVTAAGLNASPMVSTSNASQLDTSPGLLTTATYIGNAEILNSNNHINNGGGIVGGNSAINVYGGGGTACVGGGSIATTGSLITLANTVHTAKTLGLSLGSSTTVNPSASTSLPTCSSTSSHKTTTTIHDKINVGLNMGCRDSRKYDYKTSKVQHTTASATSTSNNNNGQNYQALAEFVPQNAPTNSTGNVGTNQPGAATIYRQTPSSPAPRNRYVQATTMYPQVHQSVMLQQFGTPYATRQPQFQQFQYSPNYYPANSYYSYYTVQQPPQHQRAAVNPGVGVGLNSAMTVQPRGSVSGPAAAANQAQIPLGVPPVAASTVLNVGNTSAAQNVGVSPLVGMPHQPPQQQPPKSKLRSHALQIIHPITNRNILDDLDNEKNNTSTAGPVAAAITTAVESLEYQDMGSLPLSSTSAQPLLYQSDASTSMETSQQIDIATNVLPETRIYNMDVPMQPQQTPIVSAMSDAPSVEIPPSQPQKQRNKKSQNMSSSKPDQNTIQGKTEEDIKQKTDVTRATTTANAANSNCVQEPLPANNLNQQVPQQREQFIDNTQQQQKEQQITISASTGAAAAAISSIPVETPITSSDSSNNISKSCTEYFGASEQQTQQEQQQLSTIYNITESVKTMQLDEKETLTLPQQKQTNIVSNEQQQQQQEIQTQQQYANATNGNLSSTATNNNTNNTNNSTAAVDVVSSNDVINNNNNNNNNNNINKNKNSNASKVVKSASSNTIIKKSLDKLDQANDNITDKTTATGVEAEATAAAIPTEMTLSTSTSFEIDHDETDRAKVLPNANLDYNKPGLDNSSKTSTSSIEASATTTATTSAAQVDPSTENEKRSSSSTGECVHEDEDSMKDTTSDTTPSNTSNENKDNEDTNSKQQQSEENLINYNEGQWSPSNPSGKKQYNRDQLMQLRDAKASRVQPEVKNTSIFSQTNLMPAFASRGGGGGGSNKKVQSMLGSIGGGRGSTSGEGNYQNYMKQSSMHGRGGGGADGGHHNRNSGKPIIHLNLSLNQDVKLNEADNAWRPRVLVKGADSLSDPEIKSQREKDELVRRIRGILNKLTPEKFDPLVEEIIKLKIDTMEKMEAVMILVFEKAIDEPNFSASYASLCQRLINEVKARDERMESGTKSNLAYFRNALLDKTEREFTQNVTKTNAKDEKLKPIREKISGCKDGNEKVELEALLEEEERKIRRRSGGTVRFIGELFKISILTGKIINTCIEALLKDPNNEDMLECLCKLLTTVGQKFEQTQVPKTANNQCYSLETVILRMQNIASKSENTKISSRVRFMLQDVIDLRKKKWQSTRNEAPKTMQQIEKEANNEQLSNSYLNNTYQMNSMSGGGGGGGSGKRDDRGGGRNDSRSGNYGGSHSQRGGDTGSLKRQQGGMGGSGSHSQSGNSNNDDTWHVQTGKGNRSLAVDTSKLVGMANVDMNNKKMGGVSLFQWKNSSTQPTTTPSNSFAALSILDSSKSSSSDRDRDRDRSGPRNKGSYNKGSMERDRYDRDRGLLSRTGSSQASRENSSSRSGQGVRGLGNSSNMQKSASHSKYTQQMPASSTRMTGKPSIPSMPSSGTGSGLYRESQPSYFASSNSSQFNPAISEAIPPSSAPPAVFEEPTNSDLKLIKAVVTEMAENAANSKFIDDTTVLCINKIKENQRCGLLYYILTDYLHLANVGPMYRRHLANVVAHLIEKKYISVEHFRLAYKNFADLASELMVDIPELWLYIFEFTGPLIVNKIITVNDLWSSQLRDSGPSNFSLKFLKTFIQYCTREVGPSFTRNMWKKKCIKWSDFMNENDVSKFIQTNKLEYIEDENCQPDIDTRESKEKRIKRVVEHIEQLLKEGSNADNVIDYINGNIVDVDKMFIKSLTTTLTSFAIKDSSNLNLDIPCFQKICIPVLLRYLDSKEDLELECLYAIQLLVHSLEHPRGLLGAIFGELNDADVIPQDTFIAWRDSKDQSAGKGVAVKALNPFFNQVINGETSDDN